MHTKRHKKGNAAKRKEKRGLKKQDVKVWIHGRGMDKVIVV
jgi:hypothetical protein